jgi:hypothetical protein
MPWDDYLFKTPSSSIINYIGYSASASVLYVALKNYAKRNKTFFHAYKYADVPDGLFQAFWYAQSRGRFFLDNIRPLDHTHGDMRELKFNVDSYFRCYKPYRDSGHYHLPSFYGFDYPAFSSVGITTSCGSGSNWGYAGQWGVAMSVPLWFPGAGNMNPGGNTLYYIPADIYSIYGSSGYDTSYHSPLPCGPNVQILIDSLVGSFVLVHIMAAFTEPSGYQLFRLLS